MVVPLAYGLHFILSASHQQWYTDQSSQWTDLSGKWPCLRSHSLPAEVYVDRHKDCNTLANQSRCSKLSRLHSQLLQWLAVAVGAVASCMIYSVLPRDMHTATVIAWDHTVVGAWTAWCSDFEDHHSVVIRSNLTEMSKLQHAVLWSWNTAVAAWAALPTVFKGAPLHGVDLQQVYLLAWHLPLHTPYREGLPPHRGCTPFHSHTELAGACASLAKPQTQDCLRINTALCAPHTTVLRLYGFCPGQPGWSSTWRNIHPFTPIVIVNCPLYASSI